MRNFRARFMSPGRASWRSISHIGAKNIAALMTLAGVTFCAHGQAAAQVFSYSGPQMSLMPSGSAASCPASMPGITASASHNTTSGFSPVSISMLGVTGLASSQQINLSSGGQVTSSYFSTETMPPLPVNGQLSSVLLLSSDVNFDICLSSTAPSCYENQDVLLITFPGGSCEYQANAPGDQASPPGIWTLIGPVPPLFSPKTKSICSAVSDSSNDVAAAFEGASIALEGGGATKVASNTLAAIATYIFTQRIAGNDEVFGKSLDLADGIAQFLPKVLKHFTKTNPLSIAMEVDYLVFSGVSLASTICVRDPPDSNYKIVATPKKLPIMKTGNKTVDQVQVDYFNYISLSVATIHAAERWQEATLANSKTYELLQQNAFNKYSVEMMAAKNVLNADNLKLANALPPVNTSSFPGGATAMAAAFNAQCGKPLPSDLNKDLLALKLSQAQIDQAVCAYANSITPATITTDFQSALAVPLP